MFDIKNDGFMQGEPERRAECVYHDGGQVDVRPEQHGEFRSTNDEFWVINDDFLDYEWWIKYYKWWTLYQIWWILRLKWRILYQKKEPPELDTTRVFYIKNDECRI